MYFLLISKLIILVLINCEDVDYHDFSTWEHQCNTGLHQSPINIITANMQICGLSQFKISMWNGPTTVHPEEHAPTNLKSDYPSSIITLTDSNGALLQYISLQYHLHQKSQHTVNGVSSSLELHIVHKLNSDIFINNKQLAVIGLIFQIDDSAATTLFDSIDFTTTSEVNFNETIGPLIQNQNLFHYQGSLTTPPCTQSVNWYVVQKRFPIKQAQYDKIKAALWSGGYNNRPVQQLNNRIITYITPACALSYSYRVQVSLNGIQNLSPLFLLMVMILYILN